MATPGPSVTVHANVSYYLVDAASVKLADIEPTSTFADDCGNLVGKFDRDEICDIVEPPEAELTLTADMKDGTSISGTDTIRVFLRPNAPERP